MKTDWYPRSFRPPSSVLSSKQLIPTRARSSSTGCVGAGQRAFAGTKRAPCSTSTRPSRCRRFCRLGDFHADRDLQDFFENTSTILDLFKSMFPG